MIQLTKFTIFKYKCIETEQTFEVDPDVTVLVGMNESGKTSILEALAKTNYFQSDKKFTLTATHDYPRKEKKKMEKAGGDAKATLSEFRINEQLMAQICKDVGNNTCEVEVLTRTTFYGDKKNQVSGCTVDLAEFAKHKTKEANVFSKALVEKIKKVCNKMQLAALIEEYTEDNIVDFLKSLEKYFENRWDWKGDVLSEYVYRTHIDPVMPKFLYYDEYYALPSRICIEDLKKNSLDDAEAKTAKALFELADINTSELTSADEFEDFKAELEATQASITDELFKYWSTNKNLDIQFDIDKKVGTDPQGNRRVVEHILDIRVRNNRTKVSLPLKNRSKGFNWFFSFLVWFKKIQEDDTSNFIILLDEPGLNLHAAAQADLLRFIEDLTEKYQVVFTTHSPFMVDSAKLHRVRTVVETPTGSKVSDSTQERDPKTLFPLQAALGYDIAQNLYISKNNLLVEGTSDLIYIQAISGILEAGGKVSLSDDITIVPVGGLEKVSTFISLMRGSNLNVVCLLDSIEDTASQSKLDRLISEKIIRRQKIITFDAFVSNDKADIEDLFTPDEYLKLFNGAFHEHDPISIPELDASEMRIVAAIAKHLGKPRFNHYRPANEFAKKGLSIDDLDETTSERFEKLFIKINASFEQSQITNET